ncbi:mediator of RNA polymerase II transcription subunit 6 (MED6) [Vairimorpha necatrix]|uniref:Mediator of RNA polymerase II transcription subunit 6 n=1 Tax=Vairimorpha necatrix TaxID=6039 RepID=A0AAX4JD54_9MICR
MDNIFYVDHIFISNHQLTPQNIITYFSTSPFYDKSSINEILKMQNQYRGIDISNEEVTKYKGMYYILESNTPDNTLFVIKQALNEKDQNINLSFYYVIHGFIYKAPSNHKIYNTRINDIYFYLNEIMDFYFKKLFIEEKCEEKRDEKDNDEVNRDVIIKFNKMYE